MKKLNIRILSLILLALLFVGCEEQNTTTNKDPKYISAGQCPLKIYVVDSCEYIGDVNGFSDKNFLTHKGNCKYCLLRNANIINNK